MPILIKIIAVGHKMPKWVNDGVAEYQKRLPSDWQLKWIDIPAQKRTKHANTESILQKEATEILKQVDKDDVCIALDRIGKNIDTEMLAKQISQWQLDNINCAILIGGPEGLHKQCFERANYRWSLSALTMPHPMVRILLSEQIYRAWSILNRHPYHRGNTC